MTRRPTWSVPAHVTRWIDGDTVVLILDLGWHIYYEAKCRIAGINAPEMNTAEGRDAKAYAEALLPVDSLVLFTSHSLDKYGRALGSITDAKGEDFAAHMLGAGKAVTAK